MFTIRIYNLKSTYICYICKYAQLFSNLNRKFNFKGQSEFKYYVEQISVLMDKIEVSIHLPK